MCDSGISKEIKRRLTIMQMTEHDARLFMNDPIVHNASSYLAKLMLEYGVPKIAAAFRAALVLYNREKRSG